MSLSDITPAPEAPASSSDDSYAPDPANPDDRDMFSECHTPFVMPAEVWILWAENPDHPGHGHWIPTFDDAPGGPTFLASFSFSEAEAAARHQMNNHGIVGRPVRVK